MKSNNFKNRLTALALCFTLLLGAAPITRAYAVNDESRYLIEPVGFRQQGHLVHRFGAARILPTARIPGRDADNDRTLPQRK